MISWLNCYSDKRSGYDSKNKELQRSDFQRDYDRLIFSAAFRRLQNKTQVFPLPGSSTFVHNRLTHSLEVASVGRSLGNMVGEGIAEMITDEAAKYFYLHDLASVISAGCIAHDIGNPAFGHSGEKAISNYFIKNKGQVINGESLENHFSTEEWSDLINFEGNANALRVLTQKQNGKLQGGLNLTYATLCSILKYPCESTATDKTYNHRKKYGFFKSERAIFIDIAETSHMQLDEESPLSYYRHPYVYLVEAADDICYRIIDLEDAHRINLLGREEVEDLLLDLISELSANPTSISETKETLKQLGNANEAISYLRAKSIGLLVNACAHHFLMNQEPILAGAYESTLIDDIELMAPALTAIQEVSIEKIYNHHSVIQVELAGYKVMSGLLETFIPAVISDKPDNIEKKVFHLIPSQYHVPSGASAYEKALSIVDFVSGMTDDYAVDMYRKFMGIDIAAHSL